MNEQRRIPAAVYGMRSTLVGILANAILAGVKAIAGIIGNSYALIADAIESTFDIVTSLIVLSGIKIASVPADEDHPSGHGKAEPLTAMAVSVVMCTAAVGIAIQSVREILTPHHTPASFTLVVLVVVVITKEYLFRSVLRVGFAVHSTAVTTDAWHHRSDAITSLAAFLGISIALIGGKGYESADDWAALFASCVIAYNGLRLLRPAIAEVMDSAPPPGIESDIRRVALQVEGVAGLDKCFVRKMGLAYYVDLHVIVNGGKTVTEGHEIAHRVKNEVRHSNPNVVDVLIHIEPEVVRGRGD